MALTKVQQNLSSTPSIIDNGNATAITIDSSENIVVAGTLSNSSYLYADQNWVTGQINNVIDSAPGALNTLNELAAAMGDDASFSTTVTNSIATKLPLAGGTLTGALIGTSATFSPSSGKTFVIASDSGDGPYIGTSGNQSLRIITNNATRITVAAAGAVTIPGTLGITGAVNDLTLSAGGISGNASNNFALNTPHSFRLNIDSDDNATGESFIIGNNQTAVNQSNVLFKVQEDGKVGIGTSGPYFPLHVQGATGFNGEAKNNILAFDTTSATTGTGGGIAFGGYSNGTGGDIYHFGNIQGIKENSTAGNYASAMIFSTRANGATPLEHMRITSAGKVGIGATSPSEKLEVDGGIKISNGNSRLYFGTEGGTSYRALEGSTNGSLLQVGENYTDIALQGKVGIGTTGPVSHLHIAAAPVGTNGAVAHILQNAATNGPTLLVEQTGGGGNQNVNHGLLIKVDGQNGGFGNALQVIGTNDNLNSGTDFNIITVKNGGNVGIGTDTPQHELVVYSTGNTTLGIVGAGYNDTLGIRFGGGDLTNALSDSNSGAAILSTQSVVGGAAVGDLRFQVNTGDSLLTAVNILSTGNVELADGKPIVSETDVGTHFYTHLATGSFYQGSNQAVAINTNIPSHNVTGNNMFSISITGFCYDSTNGGIIDCNIGMYSGEAGFHNSSISGSNIPREWIGKIRVGYTSANKVVILLGDIDTGTNYELAVSCGVQGFYGVSTAYFTDWTMSAVTSLSAYGSTLVTIHQKTTQMIGFESYSTGFSKATGWSKVSNWGNGVEAYDFGGYLTNGRFTPLQPGMYQFSYGGWAAYNSSTGQERYAFAVAKNGALGIITGANYSAGDSPLGGGTRTVYLNGSSDYVELWMYTSVATTVGGTSHYMWWQGHLLGASNSGQSWAI